jgi:hypothetical protein
MMLRPTICDGADQTGTPAKATASITHLSRGWVCAAEPFVCRLHHHGPTSDEVGMRENLTRTLLKHPDESFVLTGGK